MLASAMLFTVKEIGVVVNNEPVVIEALGSDGGSGSTNVNSIPILRMVTPEDVGELVWFLCSPGASAMTGDAIRVDKGLVLS